MTWPTSIPQADLYATFYTTLSSPHSSHPTGPPRGTPSPKPRPGGEQERESTPTGWPTGSPVPPILVLPLCDPTGDSGDETGVAGGDLYDNDYLFDCILALGERLTEQESLVLRMADRLREIEGRKP